MKKLFTNNVHVFPVRKGCNPSAGGDDLVTNYLAVANFLCSTAYETPHPEEVTIMAAQIRRVARELG